MPKNELQIRQTDGKDEAVTTPQLVVVAVGSDKNSQHALKWAADHILSRKEIFLLLHVRRKINAIPTPSGLHIPISEVEDDISSAYIEQIDLQTKELLLPFQYFCSRRGLQCKEVILNESDIAKAIVDFISYHAVGKIVLGSSNRNVFMRTFKNLDVPTAVSKTAPEFCSVYIVSKGKLLFVRPSPRLTKPSVGKCGDLDATAHSFHATAHSFQSVKSTPEIGQHMGSSGRTGVGQGKRNAIYERVHDNKSGELTAMGSQHERGHLDVSYYTTASCPSSCRVSFDTSHGFFSQDTIDSGVRSSTSQGLFSQDKIDSSGRHSNLSSFQNEYIPGEQGKGFELNSYGYGNSNNSVSCDNDYYFNSFGYGSSNKLRMGSNGPGHVPIMPKREAESWSHHSTLQDDLESKMNHMVHLNDDYNPEIYPPNSSLERMKVACLDEEDVAAAPKTALSKQRSRLPSKPSNEGNNEKNKSNQAWLQEIAEKSKEMETISSDVRYRRYSAEEVLRATDNFSDSLKIGEGGYGPVFKATLDHTLVAIKILRSDVGQGMKQFQKEVEVLSCIRHPNMVLLLGACPEYGCLVYEYMSNGSLEDRLFCCSDSHPLSWQLRFKIAAEIATGLLFLHQTKPEPLVHRDLKPGNILLDSNFVSKIADVGLARLIPPSKLMAGGTQCHMTAAAGTFCYIDPEYQKTGLVSTKSDIYALGVILLQLITARPPMGLAHNIENSLEMGGFERMLDPNVPNWPKEHAARLATIALQCAELRRKDRPDLAAAVLPQLNELRAFAESTLDPAWQASRWNSVK